MDRLNHDLTDQIAALKEAAKNQADPLVATIKSKFQALTAWAAANRSEILPRGRRSVSLSHGVIGWRMGNPTVKVSKPLEAAIIGAFERAKLDHLLRRTAELDREAILRNADAIDGIPGLWIEQTESFYAKPLDVEIEQVATVQRLTGTDIKPQAAEAAE